MKRRSHREERIGDLMQQSLASALLRRMSDARFQRVTITGVALSKDFSYAKVYASVLTDDAAEMASIMFALNKAANLLRHYVSQDIKLRIVPELKFVYDESVMRGSRISSLINRALREHPET